MLSLAFSKTASTSSDVSLCESFLVDDVVVNLHRADTILLFILFGRG